MLVELGFVTPRFSADHLEAGLQGLSVDTDTFDGPDGGALTGGNLGSLEGRSGRGGRCQELFAIAEDDLGVGAHIDEELEVIGSVRSLRDDRSSGVGADVARDARQYVHLGGLSARDVDLAGADRDCVIGCEWERGSA